VRLRARARRRARGAEQSVQREGRDPPRHSLQQPVGQETHHCEMLISAITRPVCNLFHLLSLKDEKKM
jgi:hypothetical protein